VEAPEKRTGALCPDTFADRTLAIAEGATALLMLSGGPDSATLASLLNRGRPTGAKVAAIYLNSGHPVDERQIEASNRILGRIGGRLEIIAMAEFLRALLDDPVMRQAAAPFLPFDGAIALSIMMLYAIKSRAGAVYVGLHCGDVEERQDYARPSIDRLESRAIDRETAPKIITPFLDMTKAEILKFGASMDVPYELTWSCAYAYTIHCGYCLSCRARRRAFNDAGVADPTRYRE
jgi:7-cyano-7-deazaguanine synthase